jgi:hypothetical protein
MPPQDQTWEKHPGQERSESEQALVLAGFIQRRLPPEPTGNHVLAAHELVLALLWKQLASLMGHPAVRAIFTQAIQAASHQPLAGQMRVLGRSLDFSLLRDQLPQLDLAALDAALQVLACSVERVIVGLIGTDLFLSLLGDIDLELLSWETDPPT